MRRNKKDVVVAPLDHVEMTKRQALSLIDDIKHKLEELGPLLADGALDDAGGEIHRDGG